MKILRKIASYLRPYRGELIVHFVFVLLSTLFSLFSFASVVPFLKVLFKKNVELPAIEPTLAFNSEAALKWLDYRITEYIVVEGAEAILVWFCLLIVSVFLLRNLSRYASLYVLAYVRTGITKDFRERIYSKILRLNIGYFTEERKGDLLSRTTNDVSEVEHSMLAFVEMIFRDPITFVIYLGTLLFMSWELTLFVLVLLPISGLIINKVAKSLKKSADQGQKKLGQLMNIVEETLTGIRVIHAFQAEKAMRKTFFGHLNSYWNIMVGLYRKEYLASPLSEFMGAIVMACVLWFGGRLVLSDTGLTGEYFVLYIVIFSQLIPPAKSMITAYFKLQKGAAAIDRIDEILNADENITNAPNAQQIKSFDDKIEIDNISFAYQDNNTVLEGFSLTVNKGETVALVGHSGSGKTTIANLIPRFFDVTKGSIKVDGVDIKNASIESLRNQIAIVTQESVLFNATIAENIALGIESPTQADIEKAAQTANAQEFIQQIPESYQYNVGDSGGKLSGGQKQRITIARAVMKDPSILILDEATSALDTQSEKLVQKALEKLMVGRTSLVIAHRLSTVKNADKIVVMESGKILEQGTHEELYELGGTYRQMCDLQSFE